MSLNVPTFSDLRTSVLTDLRNKLGTNTIIGKVVLNAFALVQAAKLKIYYLQLNFVYKNTFPDQADPLSLNGTLERFGIVKLGRLPFPATAGEYLVEVTGTVAATIPSGTTFKSLDASTSPDKIFTLDTTLVFAATTEQITLRALDLGTDASLETGDQLQLTQPIANVDSICDVVSVSTIATDGESTAEYRELVIQAYQLESQGGAKTDYRIWAADATGVRTVYPYVNTPAIIDLYVEANPSDSVPADTGTPTSAILTEVEAVVEFDPDTTKPLNERGRRPMGVYQINFLPIVPLDVDVEITGLSDATFLTAIQSAIVALLFDIRPFVDGADNPNDSKKGFLYESDIYGVVRSVIGNDATFTSLTVDVDAVPITIYEFEDGDIPYLNSLTLV